MKAKPVICVSVLMLLSFVVCKSYACCVSPVASFTASPNPVCIDCTVSFNATASYDPDGTTLSYSWGFGGGAYDITGANTATPTCKYNSAGSRTVTLTVTDNDNPECCDAQPGCADKSDNDSKTVYVVEVDKIKINYAGTSWDDVTGETIVVLKGTKYTFKAFPNPSGASWPSGTPNWSGAASGTGETIDVTFNSTGTYTLTAKCGSGDTGKTVTINVITPVLNTVEYRLNHTIHNVPTPEYRRNPYRNEPACWTKGATGMAKVTFWHAQNLTFATPNLVVRAETSGDYWNIADWGDSSPSTFGTPWPTADITCTAEGTINNQVEYRDYTATWKYKVPWGTNSWITTTTQNNCRLYVVLDTPGAPQAQPWKDVLDIACDVAWGCDTETEAMDEIWDDFYDDAGGTYDTYDGSSQYAWQSANDKFKLSGPDGWLEKYPSIGTVNCHDMAQAEVIFGNALGCGVSSTYVGPPFGYLNCIYPIGKGWTNNPFYDNPAYNSNPVVDGDWSVSDGRSSFGNHGFARLNGSIYDASAGCVDVDLDPDDGPVHFPYRYLDGDDTWTSDYESRVIDDVPAVSTGTPSNYGVEVE